MNFQGLKQEIEELENTNQGPFYSVKLMTPYIPLRSAFDNFYKRIRKSMNLTTFQFFIFILVHIYAPS